MTMVGARMREVGPLEPFRDGIRVELAELGYSEGRAEQLILLTTHVSGWMAERRLGCADLTGEVVVEFFVEQGRTWCRSARSFAPILSHLRSIEAVPPATSVRVGLSAREEALWDAYWHWCVDQRGLQPLTADSHRRRASACLRGGSPGREIVAEELDGAGVLRAVRAAAAVMPGPSLRCSVTALRSFLRFLHATGRSNGPLVGAVPAMKSRVDGVLPVALKAETVARLRASCDTATVTGRRDAAVLVLLVRLGLRAGEVAGLSLDDVDWRRGELTVAGKGGRVDVLPVPEDVGEALVAYVSDRRTAPGCRALFTKVVAPFDTMSRDGVAAVVRLACERAGLDRFGPHRLRHFVATETLRAGASLTEVAQLLRHTDVTTTSIYAIVDPAAVATLARRWPVR